MAARTHRLVQQNLGAGTGYNLVTVPVAVLGFVTP